MKLLLFKISLLFIVSSGFSQTKTVFNEQLSTENINTIQLDLENIPLIVKESLDDAIHLNFTMKFDNYTQRQIDSVIHKISFKKAIKRKQLFIDIKSKNKISKTQYSANISFTIEFAKGWASEENKSTSKIPKQKSVTDIVSSIYEKELTPLDEKEVKKLFVEDESAQKQDAVFLLLVPKRLMKNLKMNAKNVSISFDNPEMINPEIYMDKSSFRARKITNPNIKINNADFKIEEVMGGKVTLKNTSKVLIGEITETQLTTENSKIEIGELKKNVRITDFNSNIYLYNFSDKFKSFNLNGEYTTLYFFHPKNDFEMECFGHDTTFVHDKVTIVSEPSKTGKKSKMMERKRKNDKPFAGNIKFDIVHTNFYYPTTNKN